MIIKPKIQRPIRLLIPDAEYQKIKKQAEKAGNVPVTIDQKTKVHRIHVDVPAEAYAVIREEAYARGFCRVAPFARQALYARVPALSRDNHDHD